MRDALVVVQTASALILLVGSALLMRSFWQLSHVDAGYDTKNIFTFQIAASRPDLTDRASMSTFQYTFMDRLKALPGVESVGYITTLPLDEGAATQNITTPSDRRQRRGSACSFGSPAPAARTSRRWGSSLRRGRYFDRVEEEQGSRNVIISQAAAKLLFPGEDPIGKQVRPAAGGPSSGSRVIGVVEDVLVDDLRRDDAGADGVSAGGVSLAGVRHAVAARRINCSRRCAPIIREVIPTSPMYRIFTMERLAANAMASLSFTMLMVEYRGECSRWSSARSGSTACFHIA